MKRLKYENIFNCILGGALGDALGVPLRDLTYDLIVNEYGKYGLREIQIDCDGKARVSANTQLNIFTIDALIRAYTRYYIYEDEKYCKKITYTNYLRWQYYQDRKVPIDIERNLLEDNYLYFIQELKYERLYEKRMSNILSETIQSNKHNNNNDGFGCLSNIVPYGMFYYDDYNKAFETAIKVAKLTHGHPNAYLACGTYAVIVASLIRGNKLEQSIQIAIDILKEKKDSEEILSYIALAFKMAKEQIHYPEKFDDFGMCKKAHEVLAAAIYVCLIGQNNISNALLFSVNNSCYSNNIATVVGQILGLYRGLDEICIKWSQKIEMYNLIKDISKDLYQVVNRNLPSEIENYDKELQIDEMQYENIKNISKWWLVKYDKI